MANLVVPELGESVVEATVGTWHKAVGDAVKAGDVIVSLETDKVDVEVTAETDGVLVEIKHGEEVDVNIGDVLGIIDANGTAAAPSAPAPVAEPVPAAPAPVAAATASATPVAQRIAADKGVDLSNVAGTGVGGRVTKNDVLGQSAPAAAPAPKAAPKTAPAPAAASSANAGREERVKMSRRRRTIAKRLVEAQQTAAMLTTFNEMDMSAVMDVRKRRKEWFIEQEGVKLGFTSFFVKAVVSALKAFPRLNAEIQGDEMVLKHFYDIGIAVGAPEGLVVPVVRNADSKSFAAIEKDVRRMGMAARDNSLTLEDLRGGTFTITNGGIFGSLQSTPILNPPQVGILGLHGIKERPIALNGEVVIRPMMYTALSYDHRIVDGREAVQFLVRVKELIEDPESLLLA